MSADNPNEGMSGKMKAAIGVLGFFGTLLSLNNKHNQPLAATPQEPKPIVQNVPGLPVEIDGLKVKNYTPLPSSTATTAALADAKVQ